MSVRVTGWHVQSLEDMCAWKGTALPRALREAQRRPWRSVHKAAPRSISFLMDGGCFMVVAYVCCSESGEVSLGTEGMEKSKHLTLSRTAISRICCSFQEAGMSAQVSNWFDPAALFSSVCQDTCCAELWPVQWCSGVALTSSVSITFLR